MVNTLSWKIKQGKEYFNLYFIDIFKAYRPGSGQNATRIE